MRKVTLIFQFFQPERVAIDPCRQTLVKDPMALPEEIQKAARAIREGKLVIFPTETVYGLGANALDARACADIYNAKGRPAFNPLIVHLGQASDIMKYSASPPDLALRLAERFWPGPLTLVLRKTDLIPELVTAGQSTVGLRVPDHPIARELIQRAETPIAAPSANSYTRVSPTCLTHLEPSIRKRAAYILEGGPCRVGLESTIVGFIEDEACLLRPGGIESEAIEAVIGQRLVSPPKNIQTPGMAKRHYAPRTTIRLVEQDNLERLHAELSNGARVGSITLRPHSTSGNHPLSSSGDLREAASQLFKILHTVDHGNYEVILAEILPEEGLGAAINDRLRRSSHPENTSNH